MLPPAGRRGPLDPENGDQPRQEIPLHLRPVPGKAPEAATQAPESSASPAPADAPTPTPLARTLGRRRHPAQGAMEPEQRAVTQAEIVAFETVEVEMGGRARLVGMLSAAPLTKELRLVTHLIADPNNDHESLARICALGRVDLATVLKTLLSATKARAQAIAISRIGEKLPDVAAAVMEEAIPGWKLCPACLGSGQISRQPSEEDPRTQQECTACKGLGQQWNQPDHDVQKTALKLGGLLDTHKGATLQMFNQQNVNNPGDTGTYDSLMSKLDDVIYGKGRERIRKSFQVEEVEGEVAE